MVNIIYSSGVSLFYNVGAPSRFLGISILRRFLYNLNIYVLWKKKKNDKIWKQQKIYRVEDKECYKEEENQKKRVVEEHEDD